MRWDVSTVRRTNTVRIMSFDVAGHSYRLHQAKRFDCMYERTGEMKPSAVCNPEYQRFCEVDAIWFVHQHRIHPSYQRSFMTPIQRRMFQNNRRDMGAVTVETERNNSVSYNISMEKYL
jgi:extradiol dioxygenase family protein